MKLVGVKEFYNITRAKVISAANCAVLVVVCAIATFAVDTALNSTTVAAQPVETTSDAFNPEQPDPTVPDATEAPEPSGSAAPSTGASAPVETSAPAATAATSVTEETAETSETEETEETEASSPAETTEKVTEKELYLAVYATTAINVRSGPGTDYDVVKSLNAGDQIDVIAETSNGWYKTYNGNYVSKDYVSETKPASTPKTTSRQTEAESTTREETTAEEETTTEAEVETPSGNGNTCTITFYGPQSNGDGTYNNSTATGTTCTEGRTCAADWSIYPAGTVIYIENDPLGGDGYYTVEDRGPGVKGYHIDIYADDGETGSHHTCSRTVYAQ